MPRPAFAALLLMAACYADYGNRLLLSRPASPALRLECVRAAVTGMPGAQIDARVPSDSGVWVRMKSVVAREEYHVPAWVGIAPDSAGRARLWAAYSWLGGGQPKAWEPAATRAAVDILDTVQHRCEASAAPQSPTECEYYATGKPRRCSLP